MFSTFIRAEAGNRASQSLLTKTKIDRVLYDRRNEWVLLRNFLARIAKEK